jgi:hypothetical protein
MLSELIEIRLDAYDALNDEDKVLSDDLPPATNPHLIIKITFIHVYFLQI